MEIKIYQINDCDWVAASSLEEAYTYACKHCDEDPDYFDKDEITELTSEDMDRLTFIGDDERKLTFREELRVLIDKKEKMPTFFASTEY